MKTIESFHDEDALYFLLQQIANEYRGKSWAQGLLTDAITLQRESGRFVMQVGRV